MAAKRRKKYFEKSEKRGLTIGLTYAIITLQGGGQPRKEVAGMKTNDVIQLLLLVVAAITLGTYIASLVMK